MQQVSNPVTQRLRVERSSIGPANGGFIIAPVSSEDDTSFARFHPMVEIDGFKAMRTEYFRISRHSFMPLTT